MRPVPSLVRRIDQHRRQIIGKEIAALMRFGRLVVDY